MSKRVKRHWFVQNTALALFASASVLALAGPASAQSTGSSAAQSSESSSGAASQEIVVTGTRIRGEAPVGSSLIQLGTTDIKQTGLISTADVLNTVPSILQLGSGNSYAGGQSQAGSVLNSLAYGKSPNMRGFGVGATLSLVNGHRMFYEGANMNEFDGDNYPPQMIQNVDVLQDGASAIYGSDAIAGTVNYVLRKPENTVEAYSGYGFADGQHSWFATGVVGKTWNDGDTAHKGGFIFSYSYNDASAFQAMKRPSLYNDDYSAYGVPYNQVGSFPGNIGVSSGGGVTYYGVPAGQDGSALTLSQMTATPNKSDPWTGTDAIPQISAHHFALNWNQNVTEWLQIFGDALLVERDISRRSADASNLISTSVPNSNPYSPCNPSHYAGGVVTGPAALLSACGTGSLDVLYNDVNEAGGGLLTGLTKSWEYGGGFKISLPYDWSVTASAYSMWHQEPVKRKVVGTPDPATFNYFCDPTAFSCADAATEALLSAVYPGLVTRTTYSDQDYTLNTDGKLFTLPAGDVRLAIGFEYYDALFHNQNSFGANARDPRTVKSGYGELFIPVISPDFAIPLINKVQIDIAGRYDDYSDAGITRNPKIGVNWWPVEDLKLHASYGTAFRAPGLADNDSSTQHGFFETPTPGSSISSAICLACQTTALNSASIFQVGGGANGDLQPEKSKTYSLGADWTPQAVPGLVTSINYWWTSYTGQVNFPAYNAGAAPAINQQIYNSQIIYNPAYFPALAANNPIAFFGNFPDINLANADCAAVAGQHVTTQALYDAQINCINAGGEGPLFGPPVPASQVLAFENARRINAGSTVGDGLDFNVSYNFATDIGNLKLGVIAEYVMNWRVATISGAPVVQEVNRFGYPLQFKGRFEVGWDKEYSFGDVSANLFINYDNAYKMDLALLPTGAAASYANIDSYTTADLTLSYSTSDSLGPWLAKDVTFTMSIQNLLDTDPPLVLDQGGAAGFGTRFDPTYGSPLGRTIQFQIGKKFW